MCGGGVPCQKDSPSIQAKALALDLLPRCHWSYLHHWHAVVYNVGAGKSCIFSRLCYQPEQIRLVRKDGAGMMGRIKGAQDGRNSTWWIIYRVSVGNP